MIISRKQNNDEKKQINNFIKQYIDLYPDYLKEEITHKVYKGFTNNNDTINQIYCYLNIVSDKINPYLTFYNYLNNNFDINNKHILEIGAGTIPIMAEILNAKCNAIVSIIDPLIIFKTSNEIKVLKSKFTDTTNIESYDILIGYNPCAATECIIKRAIDGNKSFCIATCGCCFLPENYEERTPEAWHKYLINLAKTLGKDKYEIFVDYFDADLKISYPIISGKIINMQK